ncbi:hypothetical protein OG946_18840 [Streptomyces sp. NBC_01808]|nr:hypothetical protein [Streptomyces sp. NBC_01808]WSA39237.1 hypothetical protein OG946_18840 [Streptomyces sp. NBC_01808]
MALVVNVLEAPREFEIFLDAVSRDEGGHYLARVDNCTCYAPASYVA